MTRTTAFFRRLSGGFLLFLFGISSALAEKKVIDSKPVFDCQDDKCGADAGLKELLGVLGGSGIIQGDSLIEVTLKVVKVALTLLGTVAFVAFIWAGALYILAFTNEENAETAKKVMMWTAIGIVVILLSYAVTNFLITLTT